MDMEPSTIFSISLIGLAAWAYILYNIIQGATQSKKSIQLQEAQIKLLVSIALKLGVPKEDVINDTKDLM